MSADRRSKHKEQTYHEIISTARAQMAEKGAAALSLRGIARRMEMTAPALYRYFEDRDALVTALISIAYQSLQKYLESARLKFQDKTVIEQLVKVGLAYREWALENREDYALIFGTPIPGYHAPPESTLPLARSSLGELIQVLEKGVQQGEFTLTRNPPKLAESILADPPGVAWAAPLVTTALALWGQVHGLTSLELFGHFDTLLDDPSELFANQLKDTIKLLVKGKYDG
jgi:AcrR family transcriptional regulator